MHGFFVNPPPHINVDVLSRGGFSKDKVAVKIHLSIGLVYTFSETKKSIVKKILTATVFEILKEQN